MAFYKYLLSLFLSLAQAQVCHSAFLYMAACYMVTEG
jgi:hypothetical protein